jgi:hypothetical protein
MLATCFQSGFFFFGFYFDPEDGGDMSLGNAC